MPQGPVGRGCEACRAQKKKCDLAKPACSRCHRLRIPCSGAGQKRFKFVIEGGAPRPQDQAKALTTPVHTPSNKANRLQQALVTRLHHSGGIGYNIAFRWGTFLVEVPKRLGSNNALDTATVALLARHTETSLRQDQTDPRAPAVTEYNRALAALRKTLDDVAEATSIETLCAVLMLVYCQARFDDQFTFFWGPHGPGIAQLLRTRSFARARDPFENSLLGPLNATLLFQSFANPDVRLNSLEYQMIGKVFSDADSSTTGIRHWQLMTHVSELMEHGRNSIASNACLNPLATEAKELEKTMADLLAAMHDELRTLETQSTNSPLDVKLHAAYRAIYQRNYGVALASSAILQCAQRSLSPKRSERHAISANICQEVLQVTDEARVYRPLGAVWTVHALICTWCATEDTSLRTKVESALLDYQKDAMGPKAELQMDQLRLLERRLCLLE